MQIQQLERSADAFQQPVTAEQVQMMCRRAFGDDAQIVSAVELGGGMYNNTYRVEFSSGQPVILRVAPEPARQSRIEHELMRNEHAAQPFLAPIASLMPRILAVDFTQEVIGRDYMFQTLLEGVPAPERLNAYPKSTWGTLFGQLGAITREIHNVRGPRFGPVAGPAFSSWSDAVIAYLLDTAKDLEDAGLDAGDVREVTAVAEKHRGILDAVTEPRLLGGDLWTVNCMISAETEQPTITGVLDLDRASWGDGLADWTIFMAARRASAERDLFWTTYGPLSKEPGAAQRMLIYRARHIGAIRLERHRVGRSEGLPETYTEMSEILAALR